jgi:hypothetical protein
MRKAKMVAYSFSYSSFSIRKPRTRKKAQTGANHTCMGRLAEAARSAALASTCCSMS